MVQSNVVLELNLQRQTRLESEDRLAKLIEEKFNSTNTEVQHQREWREQQQQALSTSISESISSCHRKLTQDLRRSAESMKEHDEQQQQQYQRMKKMIEDEIMNREEGERNIMVMVEDCFERLSRLIEGERKEREATQEMMLKLMEETCMSVEKHIAL